MSETMVDVKIYRLFGDKDEQGRHTATMRVSNYKWATGNAARQFIKQLNPQSGRYAAHGPQYHEDDTSILIFEVKYAEAIMISNGHEDILGGDYSWLYGVQGDPHATWKSQDFKERAQ